MVVYIGENSKTGKRFVGKAIKAEEISKDYDKISIVAFCNNEEEMNNIYNLYLKDLNAIKDEKYDNKIEKAVVKNEVFKE